MIQSIHEYGNGHFLVVGPLGRMIPEVSIRVDHPKGIEGRIWKWIEWAVLIGYDPDMKSVVSSRHYRIHRMAPEEFVLEIL